MPKPVEALRCLTDLFLQSGAGSVRSRTRPGCARAAGSRRRAGTAKPYRVRVSKPWLEVIFISGITQFRCATLSRPLRRSILVECAERTVPIVRPLLGDGVKTLGRADLFRNVREWFS
jgi:hypothetical protein